MVSYYAVKPDRIDAAPYYWLGAGLHSCLCLRPLVIGFHSNHFVKTIEIGLAIEGVFKLTTIFCKLYHEKTNQIEIDQTINTNFIDHNNVELLGSEMALEI